MDNFPSAKDIQGPPIYFSSSFNVFQSFDRSDAVWIEVFKSAMLRNIAENGNSYASVNFFSGSSTGEDYVSRYFINLGYSVDVVVRPTDPAWVTTTIYVP